MDGEEREGREGSGLGEGEVPKDAKGKLVACRLCMLVKTIAQFHRSGCDNCTILHIEEDPDRIAACTTLHFRGLCAITEPSRSWLARWLRRTDLLPACYALSVDEALPDDIRSEIAPSDA
jgi:transcription elongation factor SPT4